MCLTNHDEINPFSKEAALWLIRNIAFASPATSDAISQLKEHLLSIEDHSRPKPGSAAADAIERALHEDELSHKGN